MQDLERRLADDARANIPADFWLEQPQARAAFTPSEGLCCTAFRVYHGDTWVKVLNEPPSWEELLKRPAFFGTPLLFPYPYAVRDGAMEYRGQRYTLRPGREKHCMHGVVRDHRWTVQDSWIDEQGAHLCATIDFGGGEPAADDRLAEWPFPLRLTVTYTLCGMTLTARYEVENRGDASMPFGLGIHPYFPLPQIPGSQEQDYTLQMNAPYLGSTFTRMPAPPATELHELLPGQRLDEYLRAACPEGRALLAMYTPPESNGAGLGGSRWVLTDRVRGLEIAIDSDPSFQYALNFMPPSREILSPVLSTCMPSVFQLAADGKPSGIIEVEPGKVWQGQTQISVRTGDCC